MLHWWPKSFSTYDTNCPSASFYIQIAWSTEDPCDVGNKQGECWLPPCRGFLSAVVGLLSSGSLCKKEQGNGCRISAFLCNKVVSLCLLQDFAVSGIRFGTLYTENQDVANAVASLCYFHGVCGPVQHKVAQLLRDRGESAAWYGILCWLCVSVPRGILVLSQAVSCVCSWQPSLFLKLPV